MEFELPHDRSEGNEFPFGFLFGVTPASPMSIFRTASRIRVLTDNVQG
jgi:hypothetical protein